MLFTRNEKRMLKLLLDNSKLSDTFIAEKLNISSQAVGRIRKKLEENLIKKYTLNVDFNEIGVTTMAICNIEMTPEGVEFGRENVEENILKNPNVIMLCRVQGGGHSHTLLGGFSDMKEVDDFFHNKKNYDGIWRFVKSKRTHLLHTGSILKNNPNELIQKIIDKMEARNNKRNSNSRIGLS